MSAKQDSRPGRVTKLSVANGMVVHDVEERVAWTYTARNENDEPVTLLVEHRTRPGWTVAADVVAAETTPDSQRFRVALEPGGKEEMKEEMKEGMKEATLVVRESRVVQSSISITELTDHYISSGMREGFFAEDLKRALKPVIDTRVQMAGVDRQIAALESQEDGITKDQERLRENMKSLRGSSEEKQLLQRYTRQLDEQEDRLETLRKEMAQASATRARLESELNALIQKISFEGNGKS